MALMNAGAMNWNSISTSTNRITLFLNPVILNIEVYQRSTVSFWLLLLSVVFFRKVGLIRVFNRLHSFDNLGMMFLNAPVELDMIAKKLWLAEFRYSCSQNTPFVSLRTGWTHGTLRYLFRGFCEFREKYYVLGSFHNHYIAGRINSQHDESIEDKFSVLKY